MMTRRILYIIIIALSMTLTAGAQKSDNIHRYNTKEITLGRRDFVDTIQIEFVGNQIYIPVYINGRSPPLQSRHGLIAGRGLHRYRHRIRTTPRRHQLT